jgi:hypothetical protein
VNLLPFRLQKPLGFMASYTIGGSAGLVHIMPASGSPKCGSSALGEACYKAPHNQIGHDCQNNRHDNRLARVDEALDSNW